MITEVIPSPVLARTPVAGYTLVNGTGTIITCKVPNDGQTHPVMVTGVIIVTSAETGGQITVSFTLNGGGQLLQIQAGGGGAGQSAAGGNFMADPGTTFTVSQNSALSLGAAVWTGAILVF